MLRHSWRLMVESVVVALLLVISIVAWGRLMWRVSGAGQVSPGDIEKFAAPNFCAREPSTVHAVAEWGKGRGRTFLEAPSLARRTETGLLPPVAERLPQPPLVIIPPEQNGPYGGRWTGYANGPEDIGLQYQKLSYDGLVRCGPTLREIVPNLAESWTVEDGGKAYSFRLRRGVRWSDGQPFTVDDILFWFECVIKNSDLTPVAPREYQRGRELMVVEKLSDYEVRFRFREPHGLFLRIIAAQGGQLVQYPAHYLKQFHPAYVSADRLTEMARSAGFHAWFQLFQDRCDWRNRDMPRLCAWVLKDPPPARPVIFTRNPFYWKVDPDGRQLPYMDELSFEILDRETINLRAINGEIGMQYRHLASENRALFLANRQKGRYEFLQYLNATEGTHILAPNLNHPDPVLRRIFEDRRFRIALSYAINRDELNEACCFGVGEPRQAAPASTSVCYSPAYERAYTEYDPGAANRLLDEMGLVKRDSDGIRLRPDGKVLHIRIEAMPDFSNAQLLELVAQYWTSVGVKTDVKMLARQLFYTRKAALLQDVGVGGGGVDPLLDPRWYVPVGEESIQAVGYGRWFQTGGVRGEVPPPDIQRAMELYRTIERTPDEAEQVRLFRELVALNQRNLWVIGTVGGVSGGVLVRDNFRNVPKVAAATLGWPGNIAPECFAIEDK